MDQEGTQAYLETIKNPKPLNPERAAKRLKEVKQIFDDQNVIFWLGSGTCLGCVRENAFISWDDEMDTAGVIGLHGLTEEIVYQTADAFTQRGFHVRTRSTKRELMVNFVKDGIRTDWTCHRIVDGVAMEFPGVILPLSLFKDLAETEFVGEKFLLPNPPEEYLKLKYGPDWRTPKGPGFESDVIGQIDENDNLSRMQKFQRILTAGILPRPNIHVTIFDRNGEKVPVANILVAGASNAKTNRYGTARLFVPDESYYAMVIQYPGHKEVLYEEFLTPGHSYTYRPGPIVTKEEHYKAGVRAMALVRE